MKDLKDIAFCLGCDFLVLLEIPIETAYGALHKVWLKHHGKDIQVSSIKRNMYASKQNVRDMKNEVIGDISNIIKG